MQRMDVESGGGGSATAAILYENIDQAAAADPLPIATGRGADLVTVMRRLDTIEKRFDTMVYLLILWAVLGFIAGIIQGAGASSASGVFSLVGFLVIVMIFLYRVLGCTCKIGFDT